MVLYPKLQVKTPEVSITDTNKVMGFQSYYALM